MKHNKPFSFFNSMGYQVIGVSNSGDVYCWQCIPFNEEGTEPIVDVRGYSEGITMYCDCCGADIESDYGTVY